MKRTLYGFLIFVLTLLFCITAYAADGQNLIIDYSADEGALQNVSFLVYRIGDVNGTNIVPTDFYGQYSVNFDISDAEAMNTLALTLSAYILRDDPTPDHTDVTDENGIADFDGALFEGGAYLYMAEKHFQYGNIYFCEPVIVILPYGDDESVVSRPKYEVVPENTETVSIAYRVLKAWRDDEGRERPVRIEAQLLCDGEIYDTVVLDESNNWRYQWNNLSARYHWTVTEKTVANGYVVSLTKNEKTFMLANSIYDEEETTGGDENTTTTDDTTKPTVPTTTPDEPELPQTGVVRWPVPYLACIGAFLLIVGFATYRKSDMTDE